jgi:hypothetical protein
MVKQGVANVTCQLSSQLQAVRREHIITAASLHAEVARIGSLSGLSSGGHVCSALNTEFPADWDLTLKFIVLSLQQEIAELFEHISSKYVSIHSFIFPSLSKTVDWCIHHVSGYVYQALIFLDAPSLLHGIGRKFFSKQYTRD